ncbi:MAG: dihydroneopterin aldolase [Candidatus Poseidoniales archaeon]|nr:dihydroneopterin aldolase [Candidatus Poseidoniales archaeon]
MDTAEFENQLLQKVGFSLTTLQLRNYIVDMEIGVLEEEQGVTQRIRFDVDIFISGAAVPDEDEIDRVLDYDFIRGKINEKVRGERTNLLESLVGDLIDSLLIPFEAVAASVTATKLDIYDDGSEIGCKMMRLSD